MSRLVLAAVLALALHAIGWDGELGSGDAASGNVGSGDAGSGNDVIGNSNAFGSGEVGSGSGGSGEWELLPQLSVLVAFTTNGDVSDFDDTRRTKILSALSSAAGLGATPPAGSNLTITAASVLIKASFPVASSSQAATVAASLSTALATPSAATAMFAAAGVSGLTVKTAPVISTQDPSIPPSPPAPPSPPGQPPPPESPPMPPPSPSDLYWRTLAANDAPPAFTIASAASGSAKLRVDGASPLVQVPAPFIIRIAIGLPQQEDLAVVDYAALHGLNGTLTAASNDGRFELTLGAPMRFGHAAGEPLRLIDRQAVLRTRFQVYSSGQQAGASNAFGTSVGGVSTATPHIRQSATRLFDAYIVGPDAPHLHDESTPLDLQLSDLSVEGMRALGRYQPTTAGGSLPPFAHYTHGTLLTHDEQLRRAEANAGALMLAASAAVRGWASFAFEPSAFSAATVAIRLLPIAPVRVAPGSGIDLNDGRLRGRLALTRGGPSHQRPPLPLRPLVGAIDMATSRGYWSNVSESGIGWVAPVALADFPKAIRGGPRQAGFDVDSSRESWPDGLLGSGGGVAATLSAEERAMLGVGPVASRFGSGPLYGRYTPTSELGVELPAASSTATGSSQSVDVGATGASTSAAAPQDGGSEEPWDGALVGSADLVLIEYEIEE